MGCHGLHVPSALRARIPPPPESSWSRQRTGLSPLEHISATRVAMTKHGRSGWQTALSGQRGKRSGCYRTQLVAALIVHAETVFSRETARCKLNTSTHTLSISHLYGQLPRLKWQSVALHINCRIISLYYPSKSVLQSSDTVLLYKS